MVMFEVTYVGPLYGKLKQDVPEQALICHFLPFQPAERTWTNNRISKRHSYCGSLFFLKPFWKQLTIFWKTLTFDVVFLVGFGVGKGVAFSQAGQSRWPALGMVCDGKFRSTTFGVGSFTRTLEAAPGMF